MKQYVSPNVDTIAEHLRRVHYWIDTRALVIEPEDLMTRHDILHNENTEDLDHEHVYVLKSGRVIANNDTQALADEAERGYTILPLPEDASIEDIRYVNSVVGPNATRQAIRVGLAMLYATRTAQKGS